MRLPAPLPTLLCAALWACGADAPVAAEPTFLLRTPDGITLVQNPGAGEPSVRGLVEVTRKTALGVQPVTAALVKLGDLEIPEGDLLGTYDLGKLATPLAPGAVGLLTASQGADAASVTFQCPNDVTLGAPVDHGTTQAGADLPLAWTGRIAFSAGTFAPLARLRPWDPATGLVGAPYPSTQPGASAQLGASQTAATLTVPSDGKPGYVAELVVPGLFANQASTGGTAICILERRARLTVP